MLVVCQTPFYVVNRLDWKYFPGRNKSLIAIVSTSTSVENTSYIINNVFLNFCAFFVTIVCTIILSVQLHTHAKWRKISTNKTNLLNQNKTVAKLVVVVSVIFIVCFSPNCIFFILMSLLHEFTVKGKYTPVVYMMGTLGIILETFNSS